MKIDNYDWGRLEGLGFDLEFIEKSANPCWKGYEAIGMKKKRGKEVPNCVPIQKKFSENPLDEASLAPTLKNHPAFPQKTFMLNECEEVRVNGPMAIAQLKSMMENITVILSLIGPESNLDPWMASKVAEAEHGMTAIADYLKYKTGDE